MENFTDLFGDDLTGLDGLGDLGTFGTNNANPGAAPGQPGGPGGPQQPQQPPGGPAVPTGHGGPPGNPMSGDHPGTATKNPYSAPQYPGGAGGPSNMNSFGNQGQFGGMTPTSSSAGYQGYGGYPQNPNMPTNNYSQMSGYGGHPSQQQQQQQQIQQQQQQNMYNPRSQQPQPQQQQQQQMGGWNQYPGPAAQQYRPNYRPGGGYPDQQGGQYTPQQQQNMMAQQRMGYPGGPPGSGYPPRPGGHPSSSMNQYRSSQIPPASSAAATGGYPYGQQSFPDFPRQPLPPQGVAPGPGGPPGGVPGATPSTQRNAQQQSRHGPPPGAVPVPPGPPGNLTPIPPQSQSQQAPTQPHPAQGMYGPRGGGGPFSPSPNQHPNSSPRPRTPASSSSSSSPKPNNSMFEQQQPPQSQHGPPVPGPVPGAATGPSPVGGSSLQQLEQMVMPGSKDGPPQVGGASTSPMPPKTPQSPASMRGPQMSPQQWQQQQQQPPVQNQSSQPQPPPGAQGPRSKGPSASGMRPGMMPMHPSMNMHPGMMMDQQQQQQQKMQMHPNMYGSGMRMPPSSMMPQHPGMQPMGVPSSRSAEMMGYHMSQQQQQQHPGMINAQTNQPGSYPGGPPTGARMPMQMPPHHPQQQQQPYPHSQQQQQQQHHNVPVSSSAPGQTMPVLPPPQQQPQQQQQPQYPYQNNVSTAPSMPQQQQPMGGHPQQQQQQQPPPPTAAPSQQQQISQQQQPPQTMPPSAGAGQDNAQENNSTTPSVQDQQQSHVPVPPPSTNEASGLAGSVSNINKSEELKSDIKVPTTSTTTVTTTEMTSVERPDRDSMVTPKLEDSDYKPEEPSGGGQVGAIADSSKGDHQSSEQAIPSSSDIKPEEPSSTTSPTPGGADKLSSGGDNDKPDTTNSVPAAPPPLSTTSTDSSEPPKSEPSSESAMSIPTAVSTSITTPTESPMPPTTTTTMASTAPQTTTTSSSMPQPTPYGATGPQQHGPQGPHGPPHGLHGPHPGQPQMVRMPDGSMRPNYPPQNYPMHGPYGPRMHPGMHPYGPRGPMPPPGSVGPDGRPVRPEMGVRMPDGSPMRPQMVRMPDGSMRPMGPMDSRMMGPRGPMDPRMMGPGHPEMVRMPDGSMRPMGPMDSRMMGPRGPMDPRVMGPRGPMDPRMMGPRGPMPPPHPIQMEMQHIHQQLNHLHSQNPQENPQIQEQIKDLQTRLQHLQQQMREMPPVPPPGPGQWGPHGPPRPQMMGGPGIPPPGMGPPGPPSQQPPQDESDEDAKKKKPKTKKAAGTPREKKPRSQKPSKKKAKLSAAAGVDEEVDPTADPFDFDETDDFGVPIPEITDPTNEGGVTGDSGEVAAKKKPRRAAAKKSKKKTAAAISSEDQPPVPPQSGDEADGEFSEGAFNAEETGGDPADSTAATTPAAGPKKPKMKSRTPAKPKPNKTLLQFAKKKRRRGDSEGDDFDLDATPPPSPKAGDDSLEKRRSGRHSQRKKYVDAPELNLSEEEDLLSNLPSDVLAAVEGENAKSGTATPKEKAESISGTPAGSETPKVPASDENSKDESGAASGPNYAYVDPTAEDTMVVQFILATRMGTRELESDEEDENAFEVPREQLTKLTKPGKAPPTKLQLKEAIEKAANEQKKAEIKEQEEAALAAAAKKDDEKDEVLKTKSEDEPMEEDDKKSAEKITKNEALKAFDFDITPPNEPKKETTTSTDDDDDVNKTKKDDTNETKDETKDESTSTTKDETKKDEPMEVEDGKKSSDLPKEETPETETKTPAASTAPDAAAQPAKPLNKTARMIEVEEYLVKFKNFSYLHCQWLTEEELHRGDKRINQKVKRFKLKREKSANVLDFCEEEPFNPDYIEVDRVLDSSTHTDEVTNVVTKHYLVKWRSLPYEDCTWELETDVDPIKIKEFEKWREPPEEEKYYKRRPRKHEWKKWEESPEYKNNNKLRPYQLEGVNWLLFSWYNGRNCLLADEMGLGKTIQSLAFLDGIFQYGIRGPFLVIAPLSTIPNWQREFELWSDMNVIVYHGSQTSRNMLAEYEMYYKDDKGERIPDVFKFHVLITTYECLITDILELREIAWRACVIDEAHRLKNAKCKLLEGLALLEVESRCLLSGTPLQNNINELFSLLSFLEPTQFNSLNDFMKDFGDMQNEEQVNKLQALLKPLMLRRMKEDVEKSLKPKEETIVEVELTNIQKKYYRGILEKNFSFLQKSGSSANVPNLMNTMMELRKCCIHPYLLNGAEEQIQEDYSSRRSDFQDTEDLFYKALTHSSGKMVLLDKLLPKLKANGHRVLIFSQMVKMLDILEDYLIRKQYPFERIDGRIRGNLRQAAIDRYCRPDSDRFVFLLCTKAGGLGINLVAADTCIIYDSDWNPQNDLQAQARCHRIGQEKEVKIYRLITRNTYEREMFDRAGLKLGLDKAVLQSMNTDQGKNKAEKANQMSKKEVEDLLKKGAYGALMDDDNAGDKFCEEDIDSILERRATTVTAESQGKAGGSFAKATFASADTADISVDDPDFWAKWAKKAEIEEIDEKTKLMMVEPRSRKKIQRFGGHENLDPAQCSDLDSSDDSDGGGGLTGRGKRKGRHSRRGRGEDDEDYMEDEREIEYGMWSKAELFKLEKAFLAFGWGRWEDMVQISGIRGKYSAESCEDAIRLILLYCVNTYRGDEKLRNFTWELITPAEYADNQALAKRKKSKKKDKEASKDGQMSGIEWISDEKYDMETNLDKNYRKHLDRHNNKILLRIKMLSVIQHEILGSAVLDKLQNGARPPLKEIPIVIPPCEGPLTTWWDADADKSLLIGTFRHGYESYDMMRLDPQLSFLNVCGPPSAQEEEELAKPMNKNVDMMDDQESNSKIDDDEDDSLMSGSKTPSERGAKITEKTKENSNNAKADTKEKSADESNTSNGSNFKPFPSTSELNGRLRRLMAAYQRENKREEARLAAQDRRNERRERIEQVIREREQQKIDIVNKKLTRKEENDFYRAIMAYGVETNSKTGKKNWDRFKALARLDKKYDDALDEFYTAFMAACKKATGGALSEEEEICPLKIDAIEESKAKKVLARVDLIRQIRDDVLEHPKLNERMLLCEPAIDMPDWWISGKHDKDLLQGVARHGMARMDYYVLNDAELSFKDILKRHLCNETLLDKKAAAEYEKARSKAKNDQNLAKKFDFEEEDDEEMESVELKKINKKIKERKLNKKNNKNNKDNKDNQDDKDPENNDNKKEEKEVEDEDMDDANKNDENDDNKKDDSKTDENNAKNNDKDSSTSPATEKSASKNTSPEKKGKRSASVSISPPQITLQQMEQMAKGGVIYDMDMMNDLMAQTYASAVKWPKDQILAIRIGHIVKCIQEGKYPVEQGHSLGEILAELQDSDNSPFDSKSPDSNLRDTSTPLSESSEANSKLGQQVQQQRFKGNGNDNSLQIRDHQGVHHHGGQSKIRQLLTSGTLNTKLTPVVDEEEDPIARLTKNRGLSGVEITPVNGDSEPTSSLIADMAQRKKPAQGSGSKLESALDKLGMNKRKLSEGTTEDKSKKKKRLDDIMLGLGAAKGVTLEKEEGGGQVAPGQSLLKRADGGSVGRIPDLNKLQDLLGRPDSPSEAKVQKWLEAQMGVVPERPVTPSTSNSTATSASGVGKSPKNVGNLMEWMSSLSGDEHVTVLNRFTGKKLSGTQGPKLKYLAQWLIENPMFDVDPKWAEMAKTKESLKTGGGGGGVSAADLNALKRKGPGRPPMDEPAAKKAAGAGGGIGPSYSLSGLSTMAGLDPKNPMSALASLDPKNPMSLAALYGLDPKKLDPMTAAVLGFGDPKNPLKMDPMMMAAMGMDAKTLQAMGIDSKMMAAMGIDSKMLDASSKNAQNAMMAQAATAGLDPKMLQAMGLDSKTLQAMGLDPKLLSQTLGMDPKMLQSMGMDPKMLQSMGMDPKMLAAMGYDAKTLQALGMPTPTSQSASAPVPPSSSSSAGASSATEFDPKLLAAMGMDAKTLQSMGMDAKTLQSMGMDPKTLQSMGMDPKILQSMGLDKIDPKVLQSMGLDAKTLQAMGMMPPSAPAESSSNKKSAQQTASPSGKSSSSKAADAANMDAIAKAMGLDPKKLDPTLMAALGLDPTKKMDPAMMAALGMDAKTMQAMGMDPKNPNSSQAMMAAMAAMDPNMAALYGFGMNPAMMSGIPGMDLLFGTGGGKGPKTSTSNASPSTTKASSSPRASPRPPSRQSTKSDDRRSPRTSLPSSAGANPRTSTPSSSLSSAAAALGLDPKMLANMDPNLLKAAGLDPKTLASLDPKMLGLDPRSMMGLGGLDPKALAGMDPKLLQAAGIDPKMIPGLDKAATPTSSSAAAAAAITSAASGLPPGIDPKLLAGLDPKLFDPKLMSAMMDPKMLATMDPKTLFGGMDPRLFGFDPKMFDPKAGGSGGKGSSSAAAAAAAAAAASIPASTGLDPRLLGLDPKMLQGLDSKALQSLGLDPKIVSSLLEQTKAPPKMPTSKTTAKISSTVTPTFSSLETRLSTSTGTTSTSTPTTSSLADLSKMYPGLDPKLLAGMDPKLLTGIDPKLLAGMDPKLLAGMDPKLLAGMDPKLLTGGFDPKLLGLDPKTAAAYGLDPKMFSSAGFDPKMFGLDPKMLAGLDAKTLAAYGIDPKFVQEANKSSEKSSSSASAAKPPSMLLDPKMLGLDPKMLAGLDPKVLIEMGIDPKLVDPKSSSGGATSAAAASAAAAAAAFDPKMFGMDPKMMASLGIDPKAMASLASMDPKMMASLGMDPKAMASLGIDPKAMASLGMDPKSMASLASMDPKELAKLDPKMLASLDPSLAAMYASMGMPGLAGSTSHNGISGSSSKSPAAAGGGGGTTIKAKPGTVAAALEEKKKAAAAAAAAAEANNKNHEETTAAAPSGPVVKETGGITNEPNNTNGTARENPNNANNTIDSHEKTSTADEGTDNEGSTKGGLTSEERVLLREKKKARLQKEQQDGHEVVQDGHHQDVQHHDEDGGGGRHEDDHHQDGHDQDGQDGLHADHDEGHSSGADEGSVNADGSKSDGPRLTRSGRRRGVGKLDAVVDKIAQDTPQTEESV